MPRGSTVPPRSIRDRGESEPGWANLWTLSAGGSVGGSPSRAIADDFDPLEGDGALFIKEDPVETWVHRSLAEPQFNPFVIEQHVRFPAGGGVISRPGQGGTGSKIGPSWSAADGKFVVWDGNGSGSVVAEETGFTWDAMQWYKVALHVDPITQTFDFFVDDQKYEAPDPLGFRGTISSVFFMEYLTNKTVWVDQLVIREPTIDDPTGGMGPPFDTPPALGPPFDTPPLGPPFDAPPLGPPFETPRVMAPPFDVAAMPAVVMATPEPSSLALAAIGLLSLAVYRGRRRIAVLAATRNGR